MEHIISVLPKDFEEQKRLSGFMEAKLALENAQREAREKAEQEKHEARPNYIKAEEEILRLVDDEVCDCQDKWELRQGIEKIFRRHFGHS